MLMTIAAIESLLLVCWVICRLLGSNGVCGVYGYR